MNKKIIALISSIIVIFIFTIFIMLKNEPKNDQVKNIKLTYWRIGEESDFLKEAILNYQKKYPNIEIVYKNISENEFELSILRSMAARVGPDVYSIDSGLIQKYKAFNFITPIPAVISFNYPKIVGNLKKQTIVTKVNYKSLTPNDIKKLFIKDVYDKIVVDNSIYGLPLSVDTLAMYYNQDLFDNAGISSPPLYWGNDFQKYVKQLTKFNNKGEIEQSGVAMGFGKNIQNSFDILSVLMMQNGVTMQTADNVIFNKSTNNVFGDHYKPGYEALRFYTDFSNSSKEVYSWNSSLNNSEDLFIQGKVAMIFAYSDFKNEIKRKNPKLNYLISPLPQIEDMENSPINYAKYNVEVVSNFSENKNIAWDFVNYITSKDVVTRYLDLSDKITALRSIIDSQLDNIETEVFANQLLTSKSWYSGNDPDRAKEYFIEMIDGVDINQSNIEKQLNTAVMKIDQTINIKE